jgi:PTH1 family peptidyl-tRNA hydrolase
MTEKYLIVGLGNPGRQYEATRHNIGFMAVEALAKRAGITGKTEAKFNAIVGLGRHGAHQLIIAQPLTFMNLSGEAVVKILNYYDLPSERLLVVYDDAALPFGRIRIRPAGSDAGQKGMRSIIQSLGGNKTIARLRLGIGGPPAKLAMPDFVLSRFDAEEQKDLPRIIDTALECIETWMDSDTETAMTRYNGLILVEEPSLPGDSNSL